MKIVLTVNEEHKEVDVSPDLSLMRFLREELGLTGTKNGCATGHCGSCTVIVNGKTKKSCITKMGSVNGARITTIEGL